MSIKEKLGSLFVLGNLLIFLVCCGGSPHSVDEKYFLVSVNIKLPYWQAASAGLSRAASHLKVHAELVGPDTYDPKWQQQEFRRIMKLKPAGILVSPADPQLMKLDIDAAIAEGIPVITMDSDAPSSHRLLFVGTNNYQAGVMGGQLTAKRLQGKGSVMVFTMPGQANLNERLHGYDSVFANHPQIKIVEVVDIKGDPTVAFDRTVEIARKGIDKVDAFVCLEAMAGKEVAEVLHREGIKGKTIVAMDTDQETLEWIQKGVIAATIAQKPFTMGFYGLKILDSLHHDKLPSLTANWARDPFALIPAFIDTGATLIDQTNVGEFMKARDSAGSKDSH